MSSGPDRQNSRQPPWSQDGHAEAVDFGAWLRRERELREISLREIADTTKISIRYLEALEQNRFDVLPALVFAKGFLREYATYVGINPDEVVNSFLNAQHESEPEEPPEEWKAEGRRPLEWSSGLLLAGALVVLLALVALLAFYAQRSEEAPPQPPPIAAPPMALPPPPPPEPEEAIDLPPLRVTMDFTEDCWVEITADGQRRLSELHVQGESLQIEAESSVVLTLGNPGGVRVEVNGEPFPIPGAPGRVARDVRIDLETLPAAERQGS